MTDFERFRSVTPSYESYVYILSFRLCELLPFSYRNDVT